MNYKSYRIIDGKPRWVIVDNNGKIINRNPSKDELKGLKDEPRKPYDTRKNSENYYKYTYKELLNELTRFNKEYGRPPVWMDLNNNPEYPSYKSYYTRFGGLNNALKLVNMDVDTRIKQEKLETPIEKGRHFETIILDMFDNKPEDLSGKNWHNEFDGICPNGKTYDAKSAGYNKGGWYYPNNRIGIEIFYFGAFNEDYTKLIHIWRVPGEMIKGPIYISNKSGKFTVTNMQKYEIIDKYKSHLKKFSGDDYE